MAIQGKKEAENGTYERENGHAYTIFAESPELGKIKRKQEHKFKIYIKKQDGLDFSDSE